MAIEGDPDHHELIRAAEVPVAADRPDDEERDCDRRDGYASARGSCRQKTMAIPAFYSKFGSRSKCGG